MTSRCVTFRLLSVLIFLEKLIVFTINERKIILERLNLSRRAGFADGKLSLTRYSVFIRVTKELKNPTRSTHYIVNAKLPYNADDQYNNP